MPKRTALREREARIREMRARLGPSKSGSEHRYKARPGTSVASPAPWLARRTTAPADRPGAAPSRPPPGGPPGVHAP
jgi:hypothetical protein